MFALGVCGDMKLLSAITVATVKATVVKKPKTFCSRTRAECMIVVGVSCQICVGALRDQSVGRSMEVFRGGMRSGELAVWRS
jgi:hypothetical protein